MWNHVEGECQGSVRCFLSSSAVSFTFAASSTSSLVSWQSYFFSTFWLFWVFWSNGLCACVRVCVRACMYFWLGMCSFLGRLCVGMPMCGQRSEDASAVCSWDRSCWTWTGLATSKPQWSWPCDIELAGCLLSLWGLGSVLCPHACAASTSRHTAVCPSLRPLTYYL
jgi:hypothetical protein